MTALTDKARALAVLVQTVTNEADEDGYIVLNEDDRERLHAASEDVLVACAEEEKK